MQIIREKRLRDIMRGSRIGDAFLGVSVVKGKPSLKTLHVVLITNNTEQVSEFFQWEIFSHELKEPTRGFRVLLNENKPALG
jgi:hypothetical protein